MFYNPSDLRIGGWVQIPKLREMRELQGLTQKDLADVSGVSVRSIAGYEGGASVRPNTARKLATALDVKVADLVEVAPPKARALPPRDAETAAAPPSVEWAIAASDEEYEGWIQTASAPDLHQVFIALDRHASGVEHAAFRAHVLARSQRAIDRFFRIMGPVTEWIDRRPSASVEDADHEEREAV
jgi:transcriptional regulator with XRE-family HTH domain